MCWHKFGRENETKITHIVHMMIVHESSYLKGVDCNGEVIFHRRSLEQ